MSDRQSTSWAPRTAPGAARVVAKALSLGAAGAVLDPFLGQRGTVQALIAAGVLLTLAGMALRVASSAPLAVWTTLAVLGPLGSSLIIHAGTGSTTALVWLVFWAVYAASQFRAPAAWCFVAIVIASGVVIYLSDPGAVPGATYTVLTVAVLLITAVILEAGRHQDQLFLELRRISGTDDLTGLPTRRVLTARVESARDDDGGLVLLDIDHFKSINDVFGHPAGDRALVAVADALRRVAATAQALPARLGGDELALFATGGAAELASIAAAVVDQVGATRVEGAALSVSVGFAHGTSAGFDDLYARADAALYAAKVSGRGRAVNADDERLGRSTVRSTGGGASRGDETSTAHDRRRAPEEPCPTPYGARRDRST